MKNRNNKGFSMIEILVVLALMAILTAATVGVYSWTHSAKVKSAARTLDSSISELRNLTLTKSGEWKLEVTKESKGYKAIIYTGKNSGGTILWDKYKTYTLDKAVSIYCKNSTYGRADIGKNYGGSNDCMFSFKFNKSNGSFEEELCYRTNSISYNINDVNVYYDGYSRIIHLVELTGKHSVNK